MSSLVIPYFDAAGGLRDVALQLSISASAAIKERAERHRGRTSDPDHPETGPNHEHHEVVYA